MLQRGLWDDIELADEPDTSLMFHPGWVNDRETLAFALRETGWFATNAEPFQAAEDAELKWGWIGVTEDRTVVICDSEGIAAATGAPVNNILQVTLARIASSP